MLIKNIKLLVQQGGQNDFELFRSFGRISSNIDAESKSLEEFINSSKSSSFQSAIDKSVQSSLESFKSCESEHQDKENQVNHSKIIRKIEKMLVELMIDFNQATII